MDLVNVVPQVTWFFIRVVSQWTMYIKFNIVEILLQVVSPPCNLIVCTQSCNLIVCKHGSMFPNVDNITLHVTYNIYEWDLLPNYRCAWCVQSIAKGIHHRRQPNLPLTQTQQINCRQFSKYLYATGIVLIGKITNIRYVVFSLHLIFLFCYCACIQWTLFSYLWTKYIIRLYMHGSSRPYMYVHVYNVVSDVNSSYIEWLEDNNCLFNVYPQI